MIKDSRVQGRHRYCCRVAAAELALDEDIRLHEMIFASDSFIHGQMGIKADKSGTRGLTAECELRTLGACSTRRVLIILASGSA